MDIFTVTRNSRCRCMKPNPPSAVTPTLVQQVVDALGNVGLALSRELAMRAAAIEDPAPHAHNSLAPITLVSRPSAVRRPRPLRSSCVRPAAVKRLARDGRWG